MPDKNDLIARHYLTGEVVHLTIEGPWLTDVSPSQESTRLWVAPGFYDLQFNGGFGASFSDPGLTIDCVRRAVLAQRDHGSVRVFPTIITTSREATLHGIRTINAACAADERVGM